MSILLFLTLFTAILILFSPRYFLTRARVIDLLWGYLNRLKKTRTGFIFEYIIRKSGLWYIIYTTYINCKTFWEELVDQLIRIRNHSEVLRILTTSQVYLVFLEYVGPTALIIYRFLLRMLDITERFIINFVTKTIINPFLFLRVWTSRLISHILGLYIFIIIIRLFNSIYNSLSPHCYKIMDILQWYFITIYEYFCAMEASYQKHVSEVDRKMETESMIGDDSYWCSAHAKLKGIHWETIWAGVKKQFRYLVEILYAEFNFKPTLRYKKTYWKYDYPAMMNHYLKKYVYTINHKRIGLSYLYFCLFSGLCGAMLAAFIRLELAYPGSHFFKGDSVRYIQVISAHGLIMIFYVVVPIVFGLFANYFIPFHIQSKDVAFPRLNSIGFWLLPAGFLLMSKPAFTRRQVYKNWDPYTAYKSTREGVLKNFIEILGDDIYKFVDDPKQLTYGKLHDIFNNQPDRNVFKTLDEFIVRRYWDGNITLSNRNPIEMLRTRISFSFGSLFSNNPTTTANLSTSGPYVRLFKQLLSTSGVRISTALSNNLTALETKTTIASTVNLVLQSKLTRQEAYKSFVDFFYTYQSETSTGFFNDYVLRTIKYRHFLPAIRSVEDIRWTLRDQLAGRVAGGGDNSMEILESWTDFLMIWEYTYKWAENPWKTLRHALQSKTIVMRNERCSSPTAVMSGWTFITPFSSQTRFTGVGAQDAAILSVLFAGLSSTLSFTNLLITRRVLAAPGFKNRKNAIPFLSISLFLVMRMLALITPVLAAAMIMLLMDRHWSTSFFDYAYGGDGILFHHLFWFFGHPEVYVVIIPAFGIVNSFLPYYNKRRIASKNHLVWATYVMAYMGFLVWGHHMYLVGLDHRSRSLYSTITVMISLPAVVKIVNWTLTFLNGVINVDISLYFIVSFLTFFLSGGLTGLWLSHVGLNLFVHDTFYVVAHFHFMFSCATFSALFAGFYFYYKEFFGVDYSRPIATIHYVLWTAGQWLTFTPLYWVGYNGLPRRYHDYPVMYMGWHGLSSSGHMLTMLSIFFFLIGILESKFRKTTVVPKSFGIPRTFKRLQYLQLKTIALQESTKTHYRLRIDPMPWSL